MDQQREYGLYRLKLAELKSKRTCLLICDEEAELNGFRENEGFCRDRPSTKLGIKIFWSKLMRLPVFGRHEIAFVDGRSGGCLSADDKLVLLSVSACGQLQA